MRLLERLELHRHVVEREELAFEGHRLLRQALHHHLPGVLVAFQPFGGIDAEAFGFERRDAAPDADLHAPAAHLVEHADLFGEPQRMIERQRVDQGPEAELLGALRDAGEIDRRRGGQAERRLVVFGDVVAIEAAAIVGFDDLETVVVEVL